MIYLISDNKEYCKIGFSENPDIRLKSIQTGFPTKLTLNKIIDGDYKKEKFIHDKFSEFRLNGEWFSYNSMIQLYFDDEYVIWESKVKSSIVDGDMYLKLDNGIMYTLSIYTYNLLFNTKKSFDKQIDKLFKHSCISILQANSPTKHIIHNNIYVKSTDPTCIFCSPLII